MTQLTLIPLRALAVHAADSLRPFTVLSHGLDYDQRQLVVVMADHVARLHQEALHLHSRPVGLLSDLKVAGYHLAAAQQRLDRAAIARAHLVLAVDVLDTLAEGIRAVLKPVAA